MGTFSMKNWFLHIAFTTICFFSAHSQSVFTNLDYSNTCDKFTKFEISFELPAYSNNYDPDIIDVYASFISPTGVSHKVNAFFYEGFNKLDDGIYNSCEELEQNSEKKWMIRFTPNEPGLWSFKLNRKENNEPLAYQYPDNEYLQFVCTDSDLPGFVKLRDSKYLERSNGDGFIPVGNSLPWFERTPWRGTCEFGTNQMFNIMDLMSENNINFFRFEVNFFEGLSIIGYDFTLQKNFCRYFNQKAGWQLDNIMDYAQEKNMFILFALFAHGQLGNDGVISQYHAADGNVYDFDFYDSNNNFIDGYAHGAWSLFHPYNDYLSINNVPIPPDAKLNLKSPYEFYSSDLAREQQKNVIRYIIARWGYSTNLFGYELMDEADRIDVKNRNDKHPNYIPPPAELNPNIIDWHTDIVSFIRTYDSQKHLITTAYADMNHPTTGAVYELMDFTQIHDYTNYLVAPWNYVQETYWTYIHEYHQRFQKPTFLGEHNYILYSDINDLDPNLYNLKDNMWATLHNGSLGPSSYWTQFNILQQQATGVYFGIGNYVNSLNQLSKSHKPYYKDEVGYRSYYLHHYTNNELFGWIQDKKMTYRYLLTYHPQYLLNQSVSDKPEIDENPLSMEFVVNKNGTYLVKWFDTSSGELSLTQTVFSSTNKLFIQMPKSLRNSSHGDAAFQINHVSETIDFQVNLFPNPSNSGIFEITVNDSISINSLRIFSLSGNLLFEQNSATQQQTEIDLSKYPSGVYVLELLIGGTIKHSLKMIKS